MRILPWVLVLLSSVVTSFPVARSQESIVTSDVGKRIALFEAEFAAEYERGVNRIFQGKKKELDLKYVEALGRVLDSAMKAGRLEEAVSIREEVRRIEAGEEVPGGDAAQDPPTLIRLRTTYRAQLGEVKIGRDQLAAPLLAAHEGRLREYQAYLTTEGKLDDALIVKAARDRGPVLPGGTPPQPPAQAPAPVAMTGLASVPVSMGHSGPLQSFSDWLNTVVFYQHSGESTYYIDNGLLRLDNTNGRTFHYPVLAFDDAGASITWRTPNGAEHSLVIDKKRENAQTGPFNYRIQPRPEAPLIPGSGFSDWLRTKQFRHGTGEGLIWTLDGGDVLTYLPGNNGPPLRRFPVIVIYSHTRTLVWNLRSSPDEPEKTNEINVEGDLRRFRWRNPEGIYQMQPLEVEPRDPAIFGEPTMAR